MTLAMSSPEAMVASVGTVCAAAVIVYLVYLVSIGGGGSPVATSTTARPTWSWSYKRTRRNDPSDATVAPGGEVEDR